MSQIKIKITAGCFGLILLLHCTSHLELLQPDMPCSQNPDEYVRSTNTAKRLISSAYQDSLDARFNKLFFNPWTRGQSAPADEHLFWAIPFIQKSKGFGENKLPYAEHWKASIIQNADTGNVGNEIWMGMNTQRTSLRALPTDRPFFLDFNRAGEGYPFDYLQNSALPLNTPLRVIHQSRDKAWLLVESHHSSGWIPTETVCKVNEEQRHFRRSSKQIALVHEPVSVIDSSGQFIAQLRIGSFFPFIDSTSADWLLGMMIRNEKGEGITRTGKISKEYAVLKPWTLNYQHLLQLSKEFLDQPYGWGGWLNNRDCSAMIKDFFTPFGIWLPRHSKAQVDYLPDQTELFHLRASDKEYVIVQQGRPYLSLLWKPGHIMLFAGEDKDQRPVVLHTLWGIKMKSRFGKEGRAIIGRGVLTTLTPDKDLNIPHVPVSLIDQIGKMAWIVNPDSILVDHKN